MGGADQACRGHFRPGFENRAESGEATERFQALRVIEGAVGGLGQGGPLEGERRRHRLVGGDTVGVAGKVLDLLPFDAQGEAQLAPMGEVSPGQHRQSGRGLRAH